MNILIFYSVISLFIIIIYPIYINQYLYTLLINKSCNYIESPIYTNIYKILIILITFINIYFVYNLNNKYDKLLIISLILITIVLNLYLINNINNIYLYLKIQPKIITYTSTILNSNSLEIIYLLNNLLNSFILFLFIHIFNLYILFSY
jgi:hypothetical protein